MATRKKSSPLGAAALLALLTLTGVDGEFTKIMDSDTWQLVMKLSKNDFCYGSSRWTDGNAHNANYMNGNGRNPLRPALWRQVPFCFSFFLLTSSAFMSMSFR